MCATMKNVGLGGSYILSSLVTGRCLVDFYFSIHSSLFPAACRPALKFTVRLHDFCCCQQRFCYLICNNVHSALKKGRVDHKRIARNTVRRSQRDPIINRGAQRLIDNRRVTSNPSLPC